jgi:hypothetical protein
VAHISNHGSQSGRTGTEIKSMAHEPNHHRIDYDVTNLATGECYPSDNGPWIVGDRALAAEKLAEYEGDAEKIALQKAHCGMGAGPHMVNNFRVHSWYVRPTAPPAPRKPMDDTGLDRAWATGPGRDAL